MSARPTDDAVAVAGVTVRLNRLLSPGAFRNALFSMGEQVIVPALYLGAAPVLVTSLGLERYGLWVTLSAVVGFAGAAGLGVGDATLRFVSALRGEGRSTEIPALLRSTLALTALLAILASCALVVAGPWLVSVLPNVGGSLGAEAAGASKVAGLLLGVRMLDNHFSASLRGYERYDLAVGLACFTRSTALLITTALAVSGHGLPDIFTGMLVTAVLGVLGQAVVLSRICGTTIWRPRWDRERLEEVVPFGLYSWVHSLAGLASANGDRLVVATLLGPAAAGVYAFCLQLTQQVHILIASGFSVVTPATARHYGAGDRVSLRRFVRSVLAGNAAVSLAACIPIVLLAGPVLSLWLGDTIRREGEGVLRLLGVATLVLTANSASHYALLGLGEARFVSVVNAFATGLSLATTVLLVPVTGLAGAAIGRLAHGLVVSAGLMRLRRLAG